MLLRCTTSRGTTVRQGLHKIDVCVKFHVLEFEGADFKAETAKAR